MGGPIGTARRRRARLSNTPTAGVNSQRSHGGCGDRTSGTPRSVLTAYLNDVRPHVARWQGMALFLGGKSLPCDRHRAAAASRPRSAAPNGEQRESVGVGWSTWLGRLCSSAWCLRLRRCYTARLDGGNVGCGRVRGACKAGRCQDSRRTVASLLLALVREVDLCEVRPEAERDRPVERNAQPHVPAWHLEQVVGAPHLPRREPAEAEPADVRCRARVPKRRHRAECAVDERRRRAPRATAWTLRATARASRIACCARAG
jgi:hypothetical protein